jgi:hypothetical protein
MRDFENSPPENSLQNAINSLKSMQIDLSPESRIRLARLCAQQSAAARLGLWERIRTISWVLVPQRSVALAFGITLVLGVTAVLFNSRFGVEAPAPPGSSEVQLVSIHPDADGRVTLEWRDGNQRTYRIFKSDNPRDFSKAASYRVRGHRWTDPNGGGDEVAYYRVE